MFYGKCKIPPLVYIGEPMTTNEIITNMTKKIPNNNVAYILILFVNIHV